LVLGVCAAFACGASNAQKTTWQPSPGHTQIPIWPGSAPDPQPVKGPETAESSGPKDLIGGKPVVGINNVTVPTMTVYSPSGKNTGVAIVVFPGGGYQMLAIDLEGTEVCDWLVTRGITCVLLKYRVTDVGDYPKSGPYPESPMAVRHEHVSIAAGKRA
jgi:acetyl esterase/lipase